MDTKVTYVGLDVHPKSILAMWGKAKEKADWREFPNTDVGVKWMVQMIGTTHVRAVYEACGEGYGLHDRLTQEGWKVDVLAPTKILKSVAQRKRKTDVRDAQMLHELVMSHGELGTKLPRIWIPDRATREHRELVRRRLKLGAQVSRVKTTIRSLLLMHQITAPEDLKTTWTRKHLKWLTGLTAARSPVGMEVRLVLASHLRELEFMQQEAESTRKAIHQLSEAPRYKAPAERLSRIRGVGLLTAMSFLTEMGDVHRFQNRRQVASYIGLVPTTNESGQADNRKGHITRMGSAGIRKTLNQASWVFLRLNPAWRGWYERVAHRRGTKRAIVGVMRRLGILLWQEAKAA